MPIRSIFMGTGAIGLPALRSVLDAPGFEVPMVVTQPDRPAGRSRELKPSPVKLEAIERGIPVFQPESLRAADAVAHLAAMQPDLILVMAYGQILPVAVLNLPRVACLNLHASILPRHRGASPIQAAIAQGDPETGVCLMHMAAGLDTGDVVLEERVRIRRRETAGTLHDQLADAASRALKRAIPMIRANSLPRFPQDDSLATYAGRIDREHAKIDWTRDACRIEKLIRAMNPWPAAWTSIRLASGETKVIKIFSAIRYRRNHGKAGEVIRSDARGVLIAAGSGALLVRDSQIEGRKRLQAGIWQIGTPPWIGGIAGNDSGG